MNVASMEQGAMVDVVVVYEQQEYYVQAAVEPNEGINVALLQCQILSLVGVLPEEQILVTSRGEIIASPFADASMALPSLLLSSQRQRERIFVVHATTANDVGPRVPTDWREVCTRCTFGDLPVVQPAFKSLAGGVAEDLVCGACASTCGTDTMGVTPLDWSSSKQLADRFISELVVVAGAPDVPPPPGFSKVPGDLNFSASGDFVHLFVKRGGTRVITQVIVTHQQRGRQETQPLDAKLPRTLVPVNCNSGNESDVGVFLCYESISSSDRESMYSYAISDVVLILGDSDSPQGIVKIPKNLNEGCLDSEPVYIGYKLTQLGGFTCSTVHGAFRECLFQSRHLAGAPPHAVISAGCSPQSDAALSTLDNARQRADNAFLENHYRLHEPGMRNRLLGGIERVKTYENPLVQAEALKRIPVTTLHERARANPNPLPSYQDELVMQLTHWFKREFFSWMNQPRCSVCALEKTQLVRTDPPSTPEEVAGQASRVEVYQCSQCRGFTRFPRYNDPVKLLDTRTGRCGEWANCFTLCCRAMGFEARYVLDVTDHVWTEVYSDHFKRWLHCDSCEDQLDRPLTYEVGWGKKLSYIFSFSHEEVVDTARRYTQNWDDMKRRRTEVSEAWLTSTIDNMNQTLRRTIASDRLGVLDERAAQEQTELSQVRKATTEEVQGRVSGSDEWKSQRNEDGKESGASAVSDSRTIQINGRIGEGQTSVAELLQTLVKTMLMGCSRGNKCSNPMCMHKRSLGASAMSATDRAAQALHDVAAIQTGNFSAHGLATMLCPTMGSIQDFVLSHPVAVYLPLQDSKTNAISNALVDVSGNYNHAHSTGPLRKPFGIPGADGTVGLGFGQQLRPGNKLTVPIPSLDVLAVSWLARFDAPELDSSSKNAIALSVDFGEEGDCASIAVRGVHSNDALVIEAKARGGNIVTSPAIIKVGLYYHFSVEVDSRANTIRVLLNAKEVVQAQANGQVAIDKVPTTVLFQSPAPASERKTSLPAVPVISHLAVLSGADKERIRVFNEAMTQRYVCWPPLQAFDASGARPDKSCSQAEARLQSGFRVCRVRMWGSEFFDGIQLVYERSQEDGTKIIVEGPLVGNRAAHKLIRSPTVEMFLLPDEYLVGLSGRKGAWTDCIRLETNFGRHVSCGGSGGGDFRIDVSSSGGHPNQIRAIQFDVGDHLVDAIAFVAEAPHVKEDGSLDDLRQVFKAVDAAKQKGAIGAVTRYLENIVASPGEPKFQKIRASNKFFASSVGMLTTAERNALMEWCGFATSVEGSETFFVYQPKTFGDAPKSATAAMRLHYLGAYAKG